MADFKIKYAASAGITISPASLATSTTRTAGTESDVIDNTTNLYVDALVAGKITTGTSPTAGRQIDIWVYSILNDTPVYPDVLDGTSSAETITSENVRNAGMALMESILVDSTSDRTYYLKPKSVAALFGGVMPKKWGIFVAHDTGVNLNATGSNHQFDYTGVHYQSL
jgi:hypothetical protein